MKLKLKLGSQPVISPLPSSGENSQPSSTKQKASKKPTTSVPAGPPKPGPTSSKKRKALAAPSAHPGTIGLSSQSKVLLPFKKGKHFGPDGLQTPDQLAGSSEHTGSPLILKSDQSYDQGKASHVTKNKSALQPCHPCVGKVKQKPKRQKTQASAPAPNVIGPGLASLIITKDGRPMPELSSASVRSLPFMGPALCSRVKKPTPLGNLISLEQVQTPALASKLPLSSVAIQAMVPSGPVPKLESQADATKTAGLSIRPEPASVGLQSASTPGTESAVPTLTRSKPEDLAAAATPASAGLPPLPAGPQRPTCSQSKEPPKPTGPRPPGPPKKELEKIVEKIQNKDEYGLFGDPVTDEMAPGYSSIVTRPMDFSTIRQKIALGDYYTWDELSDDMALMFDNAMLYNTPDTLFHHIAATMKELANKLVDLGKAGVASFRGRTASIMRAHNAQIIAASAAAAAAAAKKAKEALLENGGEDGVQTEGGYVIDFGTSRHGGGRLTGRGKDVPPVRPNGEDYRPTYRTLVPTISSLSCAFGGLVDGASAEGVAFGTASKSLRPVLPLSDDAYLMSLCRFASGLSGRARHLVLARAAKTVT